MRMCIIARNGSRTCIVALFTIQFITAELDYWKTCKSETLVLFRYARKTFIIPVKNEGCNFTHVDNLLYCKDLGITAAETTDDIINYMNALSAPDLNERSTATCFWTAGKSFLNNPVWSHPVHNRPLISTKIVNRADDFVFPCLAICPWKIGRSGAFYLQYRTCLERLPPMCMNEDVPIVTPAIPVFTTGFVETQFTSIERKTDPDLSFKKFRGRQTVYRKLAIGRELTEDWLFERTAYFLTTCTRFCSHHPGCHVINFNIYRTVCRGLETLVDSPMNGESFWEVWFVDYDV